MSKAMRKLTAILNKAECTIIFINQLREKGRRYLWQPGSDERWPSPLNFILQFE